MFYYFHLLNELIATYNLSISELLTINNAELMPGSSASESDSEEDALSLSGPEKQFNFRIQEHND